MSDPKKPPRPARDAEALAAQIFAQLAVNAAQRGKTPEALAGEALAAARTFYRVADATDQPKG